MKIQLAAALLSAGLVHAQQPCSVKQYDAPGASDTFIVGLNDSGQMAGTYESPGQPQLGFVVNLDGSNFMPVALSTASGESGQTVVNGIDNQQRIVGAYINSDGHYSGFISDPPYEKAQVLTLLGFNSTFGSDIVSGLTVGYAGNFPCSTCSYTGFFRGQAGNYTTIAPPGSTFTLPMALNASGQIVGSANTKQAGGDVLFVQPGSTAKQFTIPNSTSSSANGINNAGLIVGNLQDSQGSHGFIRSVAGTYTLFDVPGATGTVISKINNAGVIVGEFTGEAFHNHGFVCAPVPSEN